MSTPQIATIQTKIHVQPCPCAWCRVDADNLLLAEINVDHENLLLAEINHEAGLFCLNCGCLITASGTVQTQYSNGQICDSHNMSQNG